MIESINIEDWDYFQRINEYEDEDFQKPSFKSDDFMIVELPLENWGMGGKQKG